MWHLLTETSLEHHHRNIEPQSLRPEQQNNILGRIQQTYDHDSTQKDCDKMPQANPTTIKPLSEDALELEPPLPTSNMVGITSWYYDSDQMRPADPPYKNAWWVYDSAEDSLWEVDW
jgi:hypothetical protein